MAGLGFVIEKLFSDETVSRRYLEETRWRGGFDCPRCHVGKGTKTGRGLWLCGGCGYQCSVTAGTILQDSHLPLRKWLFAMWGLAGEEGASASCLQRFVPFGSYRTAWAVMHKLRRAMNDTMWLQSPVEVTLYARFGNKGLGDWKGDTKECIAVAVELRPEKKASIQVRLLRSPILRNAESFLNEAVRMGATIRASPAAYDLLKGVPQYLVVTEHSKEVGHLESLAKQFVSQFNKWLRVTHSGAVPNAYFDSYLGEFAFWFNQRYKRREDIFETLVANVLLTAPAPAKRRKQ